MAYSTELRETAIRQYIAGSTDEQISSALGVSKHTIGNWKKLLLTTGSLEKKKVQRKAGNPYKYKPEKLKVKWSPCQDTKNLPIKVKPPNKEKERR